MIEAKTTATRFCYTSNQSIKQAIMQANRHDKQTDKHTNQNMNNNIERVGAKNPKI